VAASQDDFGMILALHVHIKDADNHGHIAGLQASNLKICVHEVS